jgi:adenine-specific DNA methylase
LDRRFIESVRFPFREMSEASWVKSSPGRPPYWQMIFWWTRKPLISARAVIAGCLLPEDTNPANFLSSIGIGVKKRRADGSPFLRSRHIGLSLSRGNDLEKDSLES